MELLYYLCGILSVGIIYAVLLLNKLKSSYTDALTRLQHHQNISTLNKTNLEEELGDIRLLVGDIQNNMEKDHYASVSEINASIKDITEKTNNTLELHKIEAMNTDKNFSKVFSEIQQLKKNLKALGQDPNFLSRYQ